MSKVFSAALLASLVLAGPALADCKLDVPAPAIPSGATATEDEMKATQVSLKAYMGANQEYMSCLEFDSKRNSRAMDQYNEAAKSMESLAKQFNAALKEFKARG